MSKKDKTKDSEIEKKEKSRHLALVKEVLENTQANIKKTLELITNEDVDDDVLLESLSRAKEASEGFVVNTNGQEKIIEGVFNGEKMVGADGQEYNVPANYASKSKLIEGDILKLTITKDGSFIYKQIGPIERQQLVAMLVKNESTSDWFAMADGKRWRLLTAAVTYFHGQPGDEVVILVPKNSKSAWAAVENIIKTK
ncbi:MAG: hypothetical protein A2731_03275 [Candidatus Buchananbacteria bacterium RIFCSPHIGHO2_01_FULL_39_8]|uniref:50S ribosomal protein L7/L12 n=1 Tax=Candidatus Buchananbacteria bacterium RIFCSPHIGHO2_01_FULL_39_8 TaxID=1797533 RepID=A0A1G1Y1K2_9BACT|nr:MAG: hypothetical protein A2731_03275 [Candidatus Buchananbacteria bacterium RIFCSPHIGHO2_01_FULL_39_8]